MVVTLIVNVADARVFFSTIRRKSDPQNNAKNNNLPWLSILQLLFLFFLLLGYIGNSITYSIPDKFTTWIVEDLILGIEVQNVAYFTYLFVCHNLWSSFLLLLATFVLSLIYSSYHFTSFSSLLLSSVQFPLFPPPSLPKSLLICLRLRNSADWWFFKVCICWVVLYLLTFVLLSPLGLYKLMKQYMWMLHCNTKDQCSKCYLQLRLFSALLLMELYLKFT